jgi:hypothetical protein
MRRILVAAGLCLLASACTQAQLNAAAETPAGQLFCAIATATGPVVAGLIDATASALSPVAIIATGATSAYVTAACAAAGGVAVSPPPNLADVPELAVVPPATTP